MTGNTWWIGPVVLVVGRLLYAEARLAQASSRGSTLIFRAATGVLALFSFLILCFATMIFKSIGHEEGWVIGGMGLIIVLACFNWPSTITIDSAGVSRHVWWKPTVSIPWEAVTELERGAGGDWTVYGSNGKTIEFSRYHADPARFEAEVLRRAKLKGSKNRSYLTTLES